MKKYNIIVLNISVIVLLIIGNTHHQKPFAKALSIRTVNTVVPTQTEIPPAFPSPTTAPTLDTTQDNSKEILSLIPVHHGYYGVFIHKIGSSSSPVYFNKNQPLLGASTIKIAIAVVATKVIEGERLNLADYAPDLEAMLVSHSESSTINLIGFINSHGYNCDNELTKMGLLNFNVNLRLATAESMGLLLEGLATNSLDLQNNQYLLDLLGKFSPIDSEKFTWAINGSLPGSYANMVGAIYDHTQMISGTEPIKYVTNDVGIWTTPKGNQYVIVLLGNFKNEVDYSLGSSFIHDIAAILSSN